MNLPLSAQTDESAFAFVSLRKHRIGQLVRQDNHWFQVIDRRLFGLIAVAKYYKPWSNR